MYISHVVLFNFSNMQYILTCRVTTWFFSTPHICNITLHMDLPGSPSQLLKYTMYPHMWINPMVLFNSSCNISLHMDLPCKSKVGDLSQG